MASESSSFFEECDCEREISQQCNTLSRSFHSSLEKLGKEDVVINVTLFNQEFNNSIRKFAKEKYKIVNDLPKDIELVINQVIKKAAEDYKYEDASEIASILDIKSIIDQVQSYLTESDQTQKEKKGKELQEIIGWYNEEVDAIIQKAIKSNALQFDVNEGQPAQNTQSLNYYDAFKKDN